FRCSHNILKSIKCLFKSYMLDMVAHAYNPSTLGCKGKLAGVLCWGSFSSHITDFYNHLISLCHPAWGTVLNWPEILKRLNLIVSLSQKYPSKS
uniref:Uncharacterized protein n=1 Tax=Macaca fascicularis TaxID=9541 RepID=A0A7N9IB59_MACFA